AIAELASLSLAGTSLTDVVRQVATLAQASIPGADEVSITLVEGAKAHTVAFTGDLAAQLDERQYDEGSGPCMDAARQGGTVPLFDLGRDLDDHRRYPRFVDAARRAGVTGSLSVGMAVPSRVVGALNMYARGDGSGLGPSSVPAAEAFAGYAATTLANAHLLHSAQRVAEQMKAALVSRATIEQAKGVLMARTGCTPDDAFAELVRLSRSQNRKLAQVAAELVAATSQR
ncbi:ANTAR domain-containing protein, partial [Aquipuribacter hungaricus]